MITNLSMYYVLLICSEHTIGIIESQEIYYC